MTPSLLARARPRAPGAAGPSALLALAALLALGGCASPTAPESDHPANTALQQRVPGAPPLPWNTEGGPSTPSPFPAEPLTQDQAVAWSLQNSPALRALLARSEAEVARTRAAARPGVLGFSIERLTQGDEVEIGRTLSLGLFDVLSWPWRHQAAQRRIDAEQQKLARQVLQHVQATRSQWVRAVAAAQRQAYQDEVLRASTTAGELARRMQAAGHFSAAQAAQHEATAIEARLASVQARRHARNEREALVRLLGLRGDEANALKLPDRLPAVPDRSDWTPEAVSQAARERRLDLRLAQARWQASQAGRRDANLRGIVDLEAAYRRDTSNEAPVKRGPELGIRLVNIDFGAATRRAAHQDERAALADWQQAALAAESQLRERLSDHQATLETAQQAGRTLAPVRQRLLNERLKQYNGMLIGPFELLSEARTHVASVITALDAQRDFWLADAALVAAIDGLDAEAPGATPTASSPTTSEASH